MEPKVLRASHRNVRINGPVAAAILAAGSGGAVPTHDGAVSGGNAAVAPAGASEYQGC